MISWLMFPIFILDGLGPTDRDGNQDKIKKGLFNEFE